MYTSVEGSKRQLPPWMMQKVGANHVSDSVNVVETKSPVDKEDIITANATKKAHKREPSRRKSSLKAKCDTAGRKDFDQHDQSGNNGTQRKRKKGDRVQGYSIKKGQNLEDHSHGNYDVCPPAQPSCDDDMEFTVEDLVAIAEQYVKDHEKKERQETSGGLCESELQFQVTNETGTTLGSPCENKNSSGYGREALFSSTSTAGEVIAPSTSQAGHPVQDMLDLFLGPLLRTTLEMEEKSKYGVENLHITCDEFPRQSQDGHTGEERVPLMKKRNTLKDKVAMLLDQDM